MTGLDYKKMYAALPPVLKNEVNKADANERDRTIFLCHQGMEMAANPKFKTPDDIRFHVASQITDGITALGDTQPEADNMYWRIGEYAAMAKQAGIDALIAAANASKLHSLG